MIAPPTIAAVEWADRRRELFGDPYLVWHDGPEFTAVVAAARADPAGLARDLAAGVRLGDPVAAQAYGVLAGHDLVPADALAVLRGALPAARGSFLVRVAEALFLITGDPGWAEPLVSVLRTGEFWGERIDAAIALHRFAPTPALVAALADGMTDQEYLVRYHAASTLLRWAGLAATASDHPATFDAICQTADPAAYRAAADRLAARLAG